MNHPEPFCKMKHPEPFCKMNHPEPFVLSSPQGVSKDPAVRRSNSIARAHDKEESTGMAFYVYLLRCSDDSYYVGHTDKLESRIAQHQSGSIAGYTAKRRPVTLLKAEDFPTREEALAGERQLKGWTRAKKEAWITDDFMSLKRLAKKPRIHETTY
ncbi:GIY-YIG nuclease family protein [Herbaspirillum sp. RTI4]|uniref:GIY-YIG nuclease family protein n=1 Tax=Herbaspirillum sp. RTI4 TaxID=3048640 RepID=UPI002B22302B|nr:GIY-YIG nuclease family protein [Herbaspirillum sp. RTI4]MEA9981051.1 GIY-YIG nuclease family protein [Herbaspirillum sp. RTI4]